MSQHETLLHELVHEVRAGRLARRQFIARLVAWGIEVPLAAAMLPDRADASDTSSDWVYKPSRRGGGHIGILLWQGPTILNPHFATGTKDQEACRPFYEPLARYDADGNLVPVLAAEIPSRRNGDIAADGRSTIWKLKRDVVWHDGRPFTADDVVFNWQYATHPAASAFTGGFFANVRDIEKIDSHSVRVNFERPTPIWSRGCNVPIVARHVFEPHLGARSGEVPADVKPMGTGPYTFVSFRPGDLVVGQANPRYHMANRPYFDSLEIKGGGDAVSAARAVVQSNEFDFAWNVLAEDDVLAALQANGTGRVVYRPTGNVEMILLNASDPWTDMEGERSNPHSSHFAFSDPAVRQAFGHLIDRRGIERHLFGRAAAATFNVLNHPPEFDSIGTIADFDIDRANAVLENAGWRRGSDGIRSRNGHRLHLLYQTSTNSARQKIQAIVKHACAKAGIELELKAVDASVFFSSDPGSPDTFGKFYADMEMYLASRGGGTDPDRFMQQWTSWEICRRSNGWLRQNKSRWHSPDYDRMFRDSENELDPVKRAALFMQMNDLVCHTGHAIPIVTRAQVSAVGKDIQAPLSGWDLALSGLHDWYRG